VNRLEEFSGPNLQSLSQLHDVEQAHISLSSLHPTHIIPMQISQFCQFRLREAAFKAKSADALAKDDSRISGHSAILRT
jgi:hypothetical protein